MDGITFSQSIYIYTVVNNGHNVQWIPVGKYSPHSPPALTVVEEVAGFDVSVNDVTRVDVPQSLEQGAHV